MVSLAVATVVAKPVPPKRPLAFFLHSRNGRKAYVVGSPGCLRKTKETQKEKMAWVAVRKMLTNADENYIDPNSFWTNH